MTIKETLDNPEPIRPDGFKFVCPICKGTRMENKMEKHTPDERRANAQLMAAAPALLAAVQNFFEWHANHFDDFDREINDQLLSLANDAEAAIATAESEG